MIKKRQIQAGISLVALIVSLIVTCVLHFKVANRDIQYEAVKVTVISAESQRERRNHYSYHVVVEYEGKTYSLINIKKGEMSKYEALANLEPEGQNNNPFFDNTVYYSNGKMYSNIDGIKTDSKEFNWKMVGLGATVVFLTLFLVCIEDIRNRKKFEETNESFEELMSKFQ